MDIELNGPNGNAFFLLGSANRFARQLDLDAAAITAEMKEGDYKHLVETFHKHFGLCVDLTWNGEPAIDEEGKFDMDGLFLASQDDDDNELEVNEHW